MNNLVKDYYDNGKVLRECYYCDGNIHRENQPAIIEYNENGEVVVEKYYSQGKLHRDNAPAIIQYYNGKVKIEMYYKNGNIHNDNTAAVISYDNNGRIKITKYYNNDKLIKLLETPVTIRRIRSTRKNENLLSMKFTLMEDKRLYDENEYNELIKLVNSKIQAANI